MLFRGIVKEYTADLTLLTKKDNWYVGNICGKYGDISFTYGIFSPSRRGLWCFFCLKFYIL